jgi:spore cortex biosynthesis protein YabQ
MWEITLKSQIITLLYGLLVGMIMSLYFDSFRILRKTFKHKDYVVFIEDIAFFFVATFITFMLLMARCNGEPRAYVLLAILLGYFLYRITLSRLILPVVVSINKFILKIFSKIFIYASKIVSIFAQKLKNLLKKENSDKKTLET